MLAVERRRALARSTTSSAIVVALPPGRATPRRARSACPAARRARSPSGPRCAPRGDADVVLVHDAARPLVTPGARPRLPRRARRPRLRRRDRRGAGDRHDQGVADGAEVVRTLDRSRLWAVQTPQVFSRAALERALDCADEDLAAATDDASLVEPGGGTVRLVPAPRENMKVTTPLDLRVAELLLAERD